MAGSTILINSLNDYSSIKDYLRFELSAGTIVQEDLIKMARAAFLGIDETIIVSTSADGGSAMGQASIPKPLFLKAVMEIINEGTGGRNAMIYGDYRNVVSRT